MTAAALIFVQLFYDYFSLIKIQIPFSHLRPLLLMLSIEYLFHLYKCKFIATCLQAACKARTELTLHKHVAENKLT
jgi:hypothetical protein